MLDPERPDTPSAEPTEQAQPGQPEASEPAAPAEAGAPAGSDWPAVAYWAARAPVPTTPVSAQPVQPAAPPPPPPPPPPTWTKAYELPSARSVVSAGFQLALASSGAVRRASIYIGLLSLGAIGPAVLLLLIGIGRLMSDPSTVDTLTSDPSMLFFEQPEIAQPLALIYVLVIIGFVLIAAIGVDAQAIAISMLAGVAAERPLRLAEAITRARQTFWRLVGSGIIVGIVSGIVSLVVAWPFLKPFDSNTGVSFIGSMIGILVVAPWAFAATCIVLGDVGVVESLRRSVRLFRARPRIAMVVVLFTLVTAAIQTLAFGAGLDVAIRLAELFQFELDQGPAGLILPGILVLAFVVAFGSLTFTIAAIVAAPQVAAFLGLTFHSGGLERARAKEDFRPGPFHWVSIPMAIVMALVVVVTVAGVPLITTFEARAASPALAFLRTAAEPHEEFLFPFGEPTVVDDPLGDHGAGAPALDLVLVDDAFVPVLPDWLLTETFDCSQPNVACLPVSTTGTFVSGAYVFVLRTADDIDPSVPCDCVWTVALAIGGLQRAPGGATTPFHGTTHAFVASLSEGAPAITLYRYEAIVERFDAWATRARSVWVGQDVVLLVPAEEIPGRVITWDVRTSSSDTSRIRDRLASGASPMRTFATPPDLYLEPLSGEFD